MLLRNGRIAVGRDRWPEPESTAFFAEVINFVEAREIDLGFSNGAQQS
jgi:hypothetical protein